MEEENKTAPTEHIERSYSGLVEYCFQALEQLKAGIIGPQVVRAGSDTVTTLLKISKDQRETVKFRKEMGNGYAAAIEFNDGKAEVENK